MKNGVRSLLEMTYDALEKIGEGIEVPTRILQASFLNSVTWKKVIPRLERGGFVRSFRVGKYVRYKITEEGWNAVNDYVRLRRVILD